MKDNISVSVCGEAVIIQITRDGDVVQYEMDYNEARKFFNIFDAALTQSKSYH